MPVPPQPKIYHICHVDRLPSIVADGYLWCDGEIAQRELADTTIGMSEIKRRRLEDLSLTSHPGLHVGQCVPFYFCPRSVMLYLIYQGNHPELTYRGGQGPIVHLEADLKAAIAWANAEQRQWAFTLSNAGARYFEDRADLAQLGEVNWDAGAARHWSAPAVKEGTQAEFLVEHRFPWHLVERIGVHPGAVYRQAVHALPPAGHRPTVEVRRDWYY
jgi:hypothetical protein